MTLTLRGRSGVDVAAGADLNLTSAKMQHRLLRTIDSNTSTS